MGRVTLPRLVDVDWTIIVKRASSLVESMHVPALLVQLDVEQTPEWMDEPPRVEKARAGAAATTPHITCPLVLSQRYMYAIYGLAV